MIFSLLSNRNRFIWSGKAHFLASSRRRGASFCDAASGSRKNSAEFLRPMLAPDFSPFGLPPCAMAMLNVRVFNLPPSEREVARLARDGRRVRDNIASTYSIKTQAPSVSRPLDSSLSEGASIAIAF